jgi:hypothetical protein
MDVLRVGDLVTVATGGPEIDGIVGDVPSNAKVVVAVMDRTRGPVLRTVARTALTERTEAGPDDRDLLLLVRRTPASARAGARGTGGRGQARVGHTRAASHRPTGR